MAPTPLAPTSDATLTPLAPTTDAIYAELWISFASLLQSYAAAHGLRGGPRATVEVTSECIVLRAGSRWLEITHHGSQGTCQREDGSSAAFDLELDGRVLRKSGGTQSLEEMDAVAEGLAREISE